MDEDQQAYDEYAYYGNITTKLRDVEEKQRILKDRLLLIGENLVETKEKTTEDILELKKDITVMKQTLEKMKDFLETVSSELSNFASKNDLNILAKQAKMFQPLEFVTKSDLSQLGILHKGAEKLKRHK